MMYDEKVDYTVDFNQLSRISFFVSHTGLVQEARHLWSISFVNRLYVVSVVQQQ